MWLFRGNRLPLVTVKIENQERSCYLEKKDCQVPMTNITLSYAVYTNTSWKSAYQLSPAFSIFLFFHSRSVIVSINMTMRCFLMIHFEMLFFACAYISMRMHILSSIVALTVLRCHVNLVGFRSFNVRGYLLFFQEISAIDEAVESVVCWGFLDAELSVWARALCCCQGKGGTCGKVGALDLMARPRCRRESRLVRSFSSLGQAV